MFRVSLGSSLRVPVSHGVYHDPFEIEVRMPGVVENDSRVGMIQKKDLKQLGKHFRAKRGQRRVDLKKVTTISLSSPFQHLRHRV